MLSRDYEEPCLSPLNNILQALFMLQPTVAEPHLNQIDLTETEEVNSGGQLPQFGEEEEVTMATSEVKPSCFDGSTNKM